MGKGKDKKAQGNADSGSAEPKAAPELSKDALASLTEKIQSGFQKLNGPAKGEGKPGAKADTTPKKVAAPKDKKPANKPSNERSRKPLASQYDTFRKDGRPPKQDYYQTQSTEDSNRGVKRQRDGEEKPQHKRFDAESSRPESKPRNKTKSVITEEEILKEILELGGSKEDLDIVKDAGLESDDDDIVKVPTGGKADAKVQSELEKFMNSIGLDTKKSAKMAVVADDSEEEDGGVPLEESSEEEEEAEPSKPLSKKEEKEKARKDAKAAKKEAKLQAKRAKEEAKEDKNEEKSERPTKKVTIDAPAKVFPKYPGIGEHSGEKLVSST